jgi:hypothetical protein
MGMGRGVDGEEGEGGGGRRGRRGRRRGKEKAWAADRGRQKQEGQL